MRWYEIWEFLYVNIHKEIPYTYWSPILSTWSANIDYDSCFIYIFFLYMCVICCIFCYWEKWRWLWWLYMISVCITSYMYKEKTKKKNNNTDYVFYYICYYMKYNMRDHISYWFQQKYYFVSILLYSHHTHTHTHVRSHKKKYIKYREKMKYLCEENIIIM